MNWLRRLRRFLTSPALIVGELCFITLVSALGAALPQAGTATAEELTALRQKGATVAWLVDHLALDHLFRSPAFLVALALATASLVLVLAGQVERLRKAWAARPTEASFRGAPFEATFLRPAGGPRPAQPIRTTGRLGLAGSPLFHAGLLMVILAGSLRALFGVEALVDLVEGERLPATVEAWGAQWHGPLGRPFRLERPLVLEAVVPERFASGALAHLSARLILEGPVPEARTLGINQSVPAEQGRLFLGSKFGPAALLTWAPLAGPPTQHALLLEPARRDFEGGLTLGRLTLHARSGLPQDGSRPTQVEVRLLEGGVLRGLGRLAVGQDLEVPGLGTLRLHGLPLWLRLQADRDPALWLAYSGFLLILLGGTLLYAVVRVDEWVAVTQEGDQERVRIALRPHRFAPLFRDRFERLVRHHGGQP